MKYYSLEHELDRAIIGSYPQSTGMADHYYYNHPDSIRNLNYDNDFVPNLDAIQLCKGVKPTDMLSVVVISRLTGRIISENFKDLLDHFHLPPSRFYKAKVINSRKREVQEKQYYLFRVLEHQNQYIDFDRSEFYIHRLGYGEIGGLDIRTCNDLEYQPGDVRLSPSEVIKPRFITFFPEVHFDIFCFRSIAAGYFVSERLKTAIEESGLTGIRLEPADFIVQQEVGWSQVKAK